MASELREMDAWLETLDVNYLDRKILSYPADVLESRAILVCFGPHQLFEKHAALAS